jgi:hypothetical protein
MRVMLELHLSLEGIGLGFLSGGLHAKRAECVEKDLN